MLHIWQIHVTKIPMSCGCLNKSIDMCIFAPFKTLICWIQELSKALGAMVAQMEDLHFAFPQNESQLPTLSQLRSGEFSSEVRAHPLSKKVMKIDIKELNVWDGYRISWHLHTQWQILQGFFPHILCFMMSRCSETWANRYQQRRGCHPKLLGGVGYLWPKQLCALPWAPSRLEPLKRPGVFAGDK